VLVHLLYDHERSSPNRAAGHIHFLLHAKSGSRLTLEFNCNWIAGLKDYPSAKYWRAYGAALTTVFYHYFGRVKPL
jgi:hypothetical protein